MKVKIKESCWSESKGHLQAKEIYDLPQDEAKTLINRNRAEALNESDLKTSKKASGSVKVAND